MGFYDFEEALAPRFAITTTPYEQIAIKHLRERRLFLTSEIMHTDELGIFGLDIMSVADIVQHILQFNREDDTANIPSADRQPIKLFINCPGGSSSEGFPLVSVIELSETPIWTINIGEWSSMAFLIGITGHRRLSLPHTTFLMHDGSDFIVGSANKVQDTAAFNKRFEQEVVKPHVLKHTSMTEEEYKEYERVELYMLPKDALKFGVIDEIITSLNPLL